MKYNAEMCQEAQFFEVVGRAFSQISALEWSLLQILRTMFGEDYALETDTLGKLKNNLIAKGISQRHGCYLAGIVALRNDFVHRFHKNVVLPTEWEIHGVTSENACKYPRYVLRKIRYAQRILPTILYKAEHAKILFEDSRGRLFVSRDCE